MRGLEEKLALVTGAGGGICTALCRRFAEEGCHVALFDTNEAAARETAAAVEEHGRRAHVHVVDITDYDGVARAVESLETDARPVEILLNNAGWDPFSNFWIPSPSFGRRSLPSTCAGPLTSIT